MKNFKKILNTASIFILGLALVPWTVVGAEPTILVQPYENIPKEGTSTLQLVGAGLEPGREIAVIQYSTAPYSEAEGDVGTGTKHERFTRGSFIVTDAGTLSGTIQVTYDIRAGGTINYCDTIQSLQRLCYLDFVYLATDTQAGGTVLQQKLYFGMAGPSVTQPPAMAPVTKDDCKDSKWSSFTTFGFKNQGACVSYVAGRQ